MDTPTKKRARSNSSPSALFRSSDFDKRRKVDTENVPPGVDSMAYPPYNGHIALHTTDGKVCWTAPLVLKNSSIILNNALKDDTLKTLNVAGTMHEVETWLRLIQSVCVIEDNGHLGAALWLCLQYHNDDAISRVDKWMYNRHTLGLDVVEAVANVPRLCKNHGQFAYNVLLSKPEEVKQSPHLKFSTDFWLSHGRVSAMVCNIVSDSCDRRESDILAIPNMDPKTLKMATTIVQQINNDMEIKIDAVIKRESVYYN
jgi:hypothetical protein